MLEHCGDDGMSLLRFVDLNRGEDIRSESQPLVESI